MDTPLVGAFLTFLSILLVSSGAYMYLNSREAVQLWRRRAEGGEGEKAPTAVLEELKGYLHMTLEWFAKLNQTSNADEVRKMRRMLISAGYRTAKTQVFYVGARLLAATVGVAVVAMIPAKFLGFPGFTQLLFNYLLVATCGYYAPLLWLKLAIGRRKDAIQRAIPDALDLMVVCVEAGLGLDQAIGRVGDEVKYAHPALCDELGVLALELRTGVQRQEALRNLASRTDLEEVSSLVAILIQTDRFGTSIGQALRVQADAMRTKRRLRAEEMAAKLPVKLLFPLIFFIFPSLFVVTVGPAVIRMIRILLPALSGR